MAMMHSVSQCTMVNNDNDELSVPWLIMAMMSSVSQFTMVNNDNNELSVTVYHG